MKRNISEFVLIMLLFVVAASVAAPPSNLSPKGIAEWTEACNFIGSGSGALPAIATAGTRYTDLSTPSAPVDYRSNGVSWIAISGAGGGITSHASLTELPFGSSGHSDFASSAAIPNNASFTLAGLSAKAFSSLTGIPTTIAGYGLTDAASTTALTDHTSDQSDPHGASMTVSESITVGSSTDVYISRLATGVCKIASFINIPPELATPTDPATGTVWCDENTNQLRWYNGTSWIDL